MGVVRIRRRVNETTSRAIGLGCDDSDINIINVRNSAEPGNTFITVGSLPPADHTPRRKFGARKAVAHPLSVLARLGQGRSVDVADSPATTVNAGLECDVPNSGTVKTTGPGEKLSAHAQH